MFIWPSTKSLFIIFWLKFLSKIRHHTDYLTLMSLHCFLNWIIEPKKHIFQKFLKFLEQKVLALVPDSEFFDMNPIIPFWISARFEKLVLYLILKPVYYRDSINTLILFNVMVDGKQLCLDMAVSVKIPYFNFALKKGL